jgi:antitoxin (DNA-binding transcriptional repressor) of toxin-antitoxin stability system
MMIVNVHEAKSQLSKLLDAAENGEDVYIMRRGTRFQVIPAPPVERPPLFGALRHLFPDGWLEEYEKAEQQFNDEDLDLMINGPIFPGDQP